MRRWGLLFVICILSAAVVIGLSRSYNGAVYHGKSTRIWADELNDTCYNYVFCVLDYDGLVTNPPSKPEWLKPHPLLAGDPAAAPVLIGFLDYKNTELHLFAAHGLYRIHQKDKSIWAALTNYIEKSERESDVPEPQFWAINQMTLTLHRMDPNSKVPRSKWLVPGVRGIVFGCPDAAETDMVKW